MHARTQVGGAMTTTLFGDWLDHYMKSQNPPIDRVELSRRSGVDTATIGRWIRNETRPSTDRLRLIAPVLGVDYGALMTLAGYGAPTEPAPAVMETAPIDPLCLELNDMLDPNSPLDDERRQRLRLIVNQVMEMERGAMKRRRRRSA
jgi:transcriptional regulator with XRE-family HTH domain